MTAQVCHYCSKSVEPHLNYCSWECRIEEARSADGQVICPNGLLIACIRSDNAMLEHEHADHPGYLFPVTVTCTGVREPLPDWDPSYEDQTHALVCLDERFAVTLYECCFAVWDARTGAYVGGRYTDRNWCLSDESLRQISEYLEQQK